MLAKKIPVVLLYGTLAALGMIAVTLITYFNGINSFIGGVAYLMYIFPLVLAIAAAQAQKKRNDGILSFREALKACFGVIVLSLAIQTFFTLILVKWIDPRFGRELPGAVVAKMEATYRRFRVPEDEIERSVADQRSSDPFGFGPMMVGLARKYIVGFPIAVLFAAIMGQRLVRNSKNA